MNKISENLKFTLSALSFGGGYLANELHLDNRMDKNINYTGLEKAI